MSRKAPWAESQKSHPCLMGIVNVTPDSFSDGGNFIDPALAIAQGKKLIEAGADILDIGGESTRPGAKPVSVQEELDRVMPVLEGLRDCGVLISIDTKNSQTMRAVIDAGAGMINDITALQGDPDSMATIARSDVFVCLMHMQGTPATMQNNPKYEDVTAQVCDFLSARIKQCETAGIDKERLVIDPGIGFGKALPHNLDLLRNVSKLKELGAALLVGVSRKRFIAEICQDFSNLSDPQQREPGTIAANLWCWKEGVKIFRIHNVAQMKQAFAVYDAICSIA